MKKSDTTARFPQAFATQADSSIVAYPLPDTKQASGRVSLLNGFPLENFTALSAGGVPPSGADFNGLFRTLTEAIRANEAGQIRAFNADYAQQIGGYPQSALVCDPNTPTRLLLSTQDDNKTNPANDTSGAWMSITDSISTLQDGLAAEKQARESADNTLISGTAGLTSGDLQGIGLHTNGNTNRPAYGDQHGWRDLALATDITAALQFPSQLSSNGWYQLPSGLILQWLYLQHTNGTFNFPTVFPRSAFVVLAGNADAQGTNVDNAFAYLVNNGQFYCATKQSVTDNTLSGYGCYIFAIGF